MWAFDAKPLQPAPLCVVFFSSQAFTQEHNTFAREEGIFFSGVICATVSDVSFLQTRLIITTLCNNADTGVTIPLRIPSFVSLYPFHKITDGRMSCQEGYYSLPFLFVPVQHINQHVTS